MYYMIYVPFIPCSYLNLFPRVGRRPGEMSILSPLRQFPPLMDNYLLPLMVNISVALCTYTAPLFMYIVSMIGMEGEIQFVCFRVYNNKHINCFSLLIEGKDPVRCRYIYKTNNYTWDEVLLNSMKSFKLVGTPWDSIDEQNKKCKIMQIFLGSWTDG